MITYKPSNVRELLEAITDEFERTIDEAERPKGGMQVPFHGDFASAVRIPTVIGRMRWWVREFKRALEDESNIEDEKDKKIQELEQEVKQLENEVSDLYRTIGNMENKVSDLYDTIGNMETYGD